MRPNQVADVLGLAAGTIRAWSMGEFRRFLSPDAQGGEGHRRDFNEQDVRIFNYVNELKKRNIVTSEIVTILTNMQANDWKDLPPLLEANYAPRSFPVVPAMAADSRIDAERRAFEAEIDMLRKRIDELEQERRQEREAAETKTTRIIELTDKLARAEAMLEMYEAGRLKPKGE